MTGGESIWYHIILLCFHSAEDPNFRGRRDDGRRGWKEEDSHRFPVKSLFFRSLSTVRSVGAGPVRWGEGGKKTRRKRSQKPERRGFSAEATKILAGPSRRRVIIFRRHRRRRRPRIAPARNPHVTSTPPPPPPPAHTQRRAQRGETRRV